VHVDEQEEWQDEQPSEDRRAAQRDHGGPRHAGASHRRVEGDRIPGQLGFAVEQEVPGEVYDAYERLVRTRFDSRRVAL
jgi:hypothetical protein